MYVKDSLKSIEINNNKNTESLWIKIFPTNRISLIIGVCYRQQSIPKEIEDNLFEVINIMASNFCIIMGDFNLPDIDWVQMTAASNKSESFLELIMDSFLYQSVLEPTRGNNILDLVLSSDRAMVNDLKIQCPIANCDHNVINWNMKLQGDIGVAEQKTEFSYNYDKGNYDCMKNKINNIDWDQLVMGDDIEKCWNSISYQLANLRDEYIPRRKNTNKKHSSFLNQTALKIIKNRNKRWDTFCKNPTWVTENNYKKIRNEVVKYIGKLKRNLEIKIAEKIKTDSKKFYAYVNRKRIVKDKIGPIENSEGKLIHDAAEMAQILNKYFGTVFTKEIGINEEWSKTFLKEKENMETMDNIDIT